MSALAFLVLLILFELLADIFAKQWALSGSWSRWAVAIAAYLAANVAWLISMRKGMPLSRGAMIFSVASALLALFVGAVLYKEPVGKSEMFGAVLGVIALILLA